MFLPFCFGFLDVCLLGAADARAQAREGVGLCSGLRKFCLGSLWVDLLEFCRVAVAMDFDVQGLSCLDVEAAAALVEFVQVGLVFACGDGGDLVDARTYGGADVSAGKQGAEVLSVNREVYDRALFLFPAAVENQRALLRLCFLYAALIEVLPADVIALMRTDGNIFPEANFKPIIFLANNSVLNSSKFVRSFKLRKSSFY